MKRLTPSQYVAHREPESWLRRLFPPKWQRTLDRADGAYVVITNLGNGMTNPNEHYEIEVTTGEPGRGKTTLHYEPTWRRALHAAKTTRWTR